MIRTLTIATAVAFSSLAMAADIGARKPAPAAPAASAACKETKGLPADAFGFATGSDVADLGAWGIALDPVLALGARGGRFVSVAPTVQVSGSFLPCLEVGPYIFGASSRFSPYGGGLATKATTFGGGLELKYKIFGRATHGVGLTAAISPNFSVVDTRPGASVSVLGNSFRLLADAELIKGRLYGAINLELFQSWTDATPFLKASFVNIRGALTTPVTDALFIGAEVSHQRAYTGTWANRYVANATYIGPTFFWTINDKWTLNGTWASQIAGSSRLSPGRALGIDNFARHQARLKLAYAF